MRLHTKVSLVKSSIRILAGVALSIATMKAVMVAGIFLVVAEMLGIAEEIDS